ncbi:serine-rich adhesin for platelets isoform X1 [Eurosta solidaginis]|uniref:serine-rich adhesin for platelets isoform X1 n=2 Tax=Eurosta solidaginis TaxID=178769 RepID=UPI003530D1BD
MATMNSVQKSIHLPLTNLSSPRVLMCSASVGTEGSVTLQLRDSSDSNQSPASTSLENALTIGYPDPEMLADVFGSLQTASFKNHSSAVATTPPPPPPTIATTNHNNNEILVGNISNGSSSSNNNNNQILITSSTSTNNTSDSTINNNNNINSPPSNCNNTTSDSAPVNKITISRRNQTTATTTTAASVPTTASGTGTTSTTTAAAAATTTSTGKISVQTVSTATNTTNKTTSSYVKNCLIRSSSCINTNNVTSLAQIMNNSSTSSSTSLLNHSNTNSNSNCSSNSNFSSSSSSNDSIVSLNSNNSAGGGLKSGSSSKASGASGVTSVTSKKSRPKLSSPTRHGPQQCQVCSKIFGNASALAKHKLTHSDERKYVCAMCSKAFKRQDHLNGHMMTHRNKKPYECKAEGCGKSYCDARSLRRHTENHHSGIITPQNQTLSPTSGTPTGLSLSPATASGDASSPDGATCIRTYISTGGAVVDATTGVALTEEQLKAINLPIKTGVTLLSPTSTSSASSVGGISLPASSPTIALTETSIVDASEGLTREQLDLISKIMKQTNQTSAQVTVSSPTSINSYKVDTNPSGSGIGAASPQHAMNGATSRPRTWNMQLLNTTQNVSITVDESNSDATPSTATSPIETKEEDINQQFVKAINPHLLNIVKMDQKPVECNLCHRKFKNIPALNGHMRLHGGYFKKDPETKKTEKKEPSGPPLQTASIGVRALIEEKIISKRKDMNKGAFVVPAPPSSVSSTSTIRRSISDLESFLSPKSQNNNGNSSIGGSSNNNSTNENSPTTTTTTNMLPAATKIRNYGSGTFGLQQIGMSQGIEIFAPKLQKTINLGAGVNLNTSHQACNAVINPPTLKTAAAKTNTTTTKGTSTDAKDSTLIELLKRGTRIAVTAKKSLNSTNTITNLCNGNGSTRQIITNNNRTVIIPSDVQVLPTRMTKSSANGARASTPASIALSDTTPLSLTISQNSDSNMSGDVYTVTYSSDASGFFDDAAEVYNVADTDMLLQTVDTMQLLNDDAQQQLKGEHSEQFETVASVDIAEGEQNPISETCIQTDFFKLETESNGSNIPPNTLPTFQQFYSKELIMQNSAQIQAVTNMRAQQTHQLGTMSSPINSPLAYPTPPSSHENMTQSSPYVEDGQQYAEVANTFFNNEKCDAEFLTQPGTEVTFFKGDDNQQSELTDSEKILKLKTVLEESAFDGSIKVEDLLNSTQDDDTECDLRDFAESNLAFLDEDQEFLNDSRNATSPLPESFFTGTIGTADEVKEVLRDVLPDESINLNCEQQTGENIIDLYYLPGLGLQSQMMPNSDDPLLSSSPRDFAQQRGQVIQTTQQVQLQQQQSAQQLQQQQQQAQQLPQPQQQQNQSQPLAATPQIPQTTQQLHYAQNMENQLQQQQQQQQQTTAVATYVGNQVVVGMQQQQVSDVNCNNATLQYNLQHLPQVQNQQQQFIEVNTSMQHAATLDCSGGVGGSGILHQQLVFTGSTDKQEIHISGQSGLLSINGALNADTNIYFASNSNNSNNSLLTLQHNTCNTTSTSNSATAASSLCMPPAAATVISTLQPLSNQTNSILKRRLRPHSLNDPSNLQSFAKYHPLSPYRSKLRKPSRTHYTPAPILNPDRKGIGLYCSARKQLSSGLLGFESFDDDFDDSVGLVDFSDESKVNLGSAYQAQIPTCRERMQSVGSDAATDGDLYKTNSYFDVEEPIGAELLWDPTVQTDDKILMRYIDLSKSSAVPLGSHSEEVALVTLLKARGNMAAAVLTLLQTQSNAFQMKWSATELEVFLKGLERHGKDFGRISLELGSKTTGECVQMYYFWKKLCVDYKLSHLKTETPPPPPANDPKPYVCEVPDCSASFTSKAALHGHTRIHTYGRNANNHNNNNNNNNNHHNHNNNNNATSNTTNTINSSSMGGTTNIVQPNINGTSQTGNLTTGTGNILVKDANPSGANTANKDITEFPCKVCGKVFNKVKSRSAHMKTHRVQEQQQQQQQHLQQQQQQQQQQHQQQQLATEAATTPRNSIASAHSQSTIAIQNQQQLQQQQQQLLPIEPQTS